MVDAHESGVVRRGDEVILERGPLSGRALYYCDDTTARFATSLRGLVAGTAVEPDPAGIRDFLTFSFAPAPRTVIASVRSVVPGQTVRLRRGRSPEVIAAGSLEVAGPSAPADLWRAIDDAVVDTPAVLLSGGLDSATVASLLGPGKVAYHARFGAGETQPESDTPHARATAEHLGLRLASQRVGSLSALRWFDAAVGVLDQPIGDPVILPFYVLSRRAAAAGHTALCTGEGGDQLFGSWALKPMLVREAYGLDHAARLRAYAASFHKLGDEADALLAGRAPPAQPVTDPVAEAFASSPTDDLLDTLRWVDIRLKGTQNILPRIDDVAGAAGITPHHPLFAPRVVRASFGLAAGDKLDGAEEKAALKRLVADRLPSQVVQRRKRGMGVPTSIWFRRGLRPLAWRWLSPARLRHSGLLDPGAVGAIVQRETVPADGRGRRWGDRLWMLCVLEAWFHQVRRGAP